MEIFVHAAWAWQEGPYTRIRVLAFGLCDVGQGLPEIGRVSLAELAAIRGPGGLIIERDLHFEPLKTLSGYMQGMIRRTGQLMA